MVCPKDIFGDEIESQSQKNFEDYFNEMSAPKSLKVGARIKGTILSLTRDTVLVDIGATNDGVLPRREILNSDGSLKYQVGDQISCTVKRVTGDEIIVHYDGAKIGLSDDVNLEDAFDRESPVEGRVIEEVKGGFRVMLPGQIKAFCPISQINYQVGDPAQYINQKYDFLIVKFESGGRNIVVSRRRALDISKLERESSFLNQINEEDLLLAEVIRIEKYGAFVRLKDWDLEGLVPLSELAWSRIKKPEEVVSLGQEIQVMLLSSKETEQGRLQLSFSLKKAGAEGDPWSQIILHHPVGSAFEGTIEKKENFGFFVQIIPGVSGLLPKSAWRDDLEANRIESKKVGEKIHLVIKEIRHEERKVLLGLPGYEDEAGLVMPSSSAKLGSFGDLFKQAQKTQNHKESEGIKK